jgi:hypothetical protein
MINRNISGAGHRRLWPAHVAERRSAPSWSGAGLRAFGTWIAARWGVAPPALRDGASLAFVRRRGPWHVSLHHATLAAPRITQTLQRRVGVTLHWHMSHSAVERGLAAAPSRIVNLLGSLQNSQTSIQLHQTFPTRARVEFRDGGGTHRTLREIRSNLHQLLASRTTLVPALPRHARQINLAVFHNSERVLASAVTRVLPVGSGAEHRLVSLTSISSTYTIAGIRELVARTFRTQQWSSTSSSHSNNTIAHRTSGLATHTVLRSHAWTVFGERACELLIRVNHEGRQSAGGDPVSRVPASLPTRQTTPVSLNFIRHETNFNTAITQTLAQIQQTIAANGKPHSVAVPQIDIPHLTRQVYDQFERELRIERERRGL